MKKGVAAPLFSLKKLNREQQIRETIQAYKDELNYAKDMKNHEETRKQNRKKWKDFNEWCPVSQTPWPRHQHGMNAK